VSVLHYDFMQRALVAAALVGLAAPAIGIFLVQRRLSLMGDGIGHAVFAGVAVSFLTRTPPELGGLGAASVAAISIELLRERGRTASDVALALIFYGGIAGGVLLTYLAGAGSQILTVLFGSLLSINPSDVVAITVVSGCVVAFALGFRKQLFAVCYDEELARVSGVRVRLFNLGLALVAAVTIVGTMRVVGILLVSALLVLPVAAAQRLTRTFRSTMLVSMVLGVALSVGGLILAFYANSFPGPTIVLTGIAAFALAAAADRLLPFLRRGTP
jgi:zinc transport system permease protein